MPRGIPNSTTKPSTLTQQLLEKMREIEERLDVERRRDRARAKLVTFAHRHHLTAGDLRDAAKLVDAREVGGAPVTSHNIGKARRVALGRAIRKAREAKGMKSIVFGKMVGAKSRGATSAWEAGNLPAAPRYRAGIIKHLDLPADFFADVPTRRQRKANGAEAAP